MKVRVKPKYQAGAAVAFISRRQAIKKLQLSMKDFRRLCILKGIYPHEPNHKKQTNKGSTENRVWYYRKDINFLAHEPIINKFREYKVFLRKLNHFKAKKDESKLKKLYDNKPVYNLDTIVKERYPTFGSAIRDLDDALCLLFVFATFPHTKILKEGIIEDCRRLSAEFMHYVIEAGALRNTFVSIKGIYYQAEICGEKVTWLVPHERGLPHITDVDFTVMVTFAEFYVAMLGFVNYRLYQMIGLYYPPEIQTGTQTIEADPSVVEMTEEERIEKVYSLAKPLAKQPGLEKEPEEEIDTFDDDNALMEKIKETKSIKNLFKGCLFFLNREVPKEALTMIIRNCGGSVGWAGGPVSLEESNKSIAYQVVDRPMNKFELGRRYVQPQWVFDSLNARRKLPVEKYMPGAALPPHFSPFTKEKSGDYVPIERLEELRLLGQDVSGLETGGETSEEQKPKKKTKKVEPTVVAEGKGMKVTLGKMHTTNKQLELNQQGHDNKLREMMIEKKNRRVYHSMKQTFKRNRNDAKRLREKRHKIDAGKGSATPMEA